MDPDFLSHATNRLPEYLIADIEAIKAKVEEDEVIRNAGGLNDRKKLLGQMAIDANLLSQQMNSQPKLTFVKAQKYLHTLNFHGIVKDSFEEQEDKEKTTLLWSELLDISEKCSSLLTDEEKENCIKCLNAISMIDYLPIVTRRLDAFAQYEQTHKELLKCKSKEKKIRGIRVAANVALVLSLPPLIMLIVSLQTRLPELVSILEGLLIFITIFLMLIINILLGSKLPGEIWHTEQLIEEYSNEAGIKDENFWLYLNENFGGIPSHEQLNQKYEEQNKIIDVFFNENSTFLS